jgi:hypothetical protein
MPRIAGVSGCKRARKTLRGEQGQQVDTTRHARAFVRQRSSEKRAFRRELSDKDLGLADEQLSSCAGRASGQAGRTFEKSGYRGGLGVAPVLRGVPFGAVVV